MEVRTMQPSAGVVTGRASPISKCDLPSWWWRQRKQTDPALFQEPKKLYDSIGSTPFHV